jgi:hypothetical protein
MLMCKPNQVSTWVVLDSTTKPIRDLTLFKSAKVIIDLTNGEVLQAPNDDLSIDSVIAQFGFTEYDQFVTAMFAAPLVDGESLARVHQVEH